MDLEKVKKLAVDMVSDPSDTDKLVRGLDQILKFTETTVNENAKVQSDLEKTAQQLERARETNIKLFEQVTIDNSVNDSDEETESKEITKDDIIKDYGGIE